jgi:NAD(P)-dependent dehydrogenase (short-subunit alcohol dehydrogenase family)
MSYDKSMLGGKRILVTGAGRGIGRSCALACAGLGAEVIAVARTESELTSLVEESAGAVTPWVEDVTSDQLTDRIAGLDRLDGLVNNAGTNRVGPMVERSSDDIDTVISLNIRALYRVSQAAITPMKEGGGGSIVNMSSQMGHVGSPNRTLYCMSKHAVEGLTRAMAVELGKEGITVNCVCPGPIHTGITAPIPDTDKETFARRRTALRRYGNPEEVAHITLALVLPSASFITGAAIPVDGGVTIRNA